MLNFFEKETVLWADVDPETVAPNRRAACRLLEGRDRLLALCAQPTARGPDDVHARLERLAGLYEAIGYACARHPARYPVLRGFAAARAAAIVDLVERLVAAGEPAEALCARIDQAALMASDALTLSRSGEALRIESDCEALGLIAAQAGAVNLAHAVDLAAKAPTAPTQASWRDSLSRTAVRGALSSAAEVAGKLASKAARSVATPAVDAVLKARDRLADEAEARLDAAWRAVNDPVARNIAAARHAVGGGLASGALSSAATALLFPPAIPVVVAIEVLGAIDAFSAEADRISAAQKNAAASRRALRTVSRPRPGAIGRFSNRDIDVIVSSEDASLSGVIRRGALMGASIADTKKDRIAEMARAADDPETRAILLRFVDLA